MSNTGPYLAFKNISGSQILELESLSTFDSKNTSAMFVSDCHTLGMSAVIHAQSSSSIRLYNSVFENCSSLLYGSAIHLVDSDLKATKIDIINGLTENGGAIAVQG